MVSVFLSADNCSYLEIDLWPKGAHTTTVEEKKTRSLSLTENIIRWCVWVRLSLWMCYYVVPG